MNKQARPSLAKKLIWPFLTLLGGTVALTAEAATGSNFNLPGISINFGQGTNLVDTIEVILFITIITLAPAILILCTCFTRIIVVLAFIRQAIGAHNMPPNQLLIGLS